MQAQPGKKINSGIEPVDELMSGLDHGQLYLVHGEASGKSLFGIKFLIEGLKQGKNGALVIRYSPEDAVRRFARLGYDCLEDVYSGRLVILEYSDDISQKIGKLRELTPLLRELEWLLGETKPERLIFDPVASVLAGAAGNIQTRASEFAEWARSFGATVVLIASESNPEIIESFQPLVAESFRFDVREVGERASRFLAFEKSTIPDQAIEVDPSRGVFLLGSSYSTEGGGQHRETPKPPSVAELESIKEELRAVRDLKTKEEPVNTAHTDLKEPLVRPDFDSDNIDADPMAVVEDHRARLETHRLTEEEEEAFQAPRISSIAQPAQLVELDLSAVEPAGTAASASVRSEVPVDELSYLLDDLTGTSFPLDLDFPEKTSPSKTPTESMIKAAVLHEDKASVTAVGPFESETYTSGNDLNNHSEARQAEAPEPRDKEASLLNDPEMAARAAELLLRAPQETLGTFLSAGVEHSAQVTDDLTAHESSNDLRPKDFNVLIIEDDAEMCDLLSETLGEYSLELVHDGVSGLARLIAFKPDLVILDFDLPIIDGFKVLTLIRTALNVPIIIVSGSRMRAIDRVMASELGADYYLTKPFSSKELRYKAKQLIARYRGINSWIVSPAPGAAVSAGRRAADTEAASGMNAANEHNSFMPYPAFAAEVEKRVKSALTDGAQFSIVGCRLREMTSDGGRPALRLLEIVRELARDGDLISSNSLNDMVVLLDDAGSVGARAFVSRLRNRVLQELNQEPAIWMRSFPDIGEAGRSTAPVKGLESAVTRDPRSTDRTNQPQDRDKSLASRDSYEGQKKTDPLDSYIDFLEQL